MGYRLALSITEIGYLPTLKALNDAAELDDEGYDEGHDTKRDLLKHVFCFGKCWPAEIDTFMESCEELHPNFDDESDARIITKDKFLELIHIRQRMMKLEYTEHAKANSIIDYYRTGEESLIPEPEDFNKLSDKEKNDAFFTAYRKINRLRTLYAYALIETEDLFNPETVINERCLGDSWISLGAYYELIHIYFNVNWDKEVIIMDGG